MKNIIGILNDGIKNASMTIYQELLKENGEEAAKEKTAALLLSNFRIFSDKYIALHEVGLIYNKILDEYKLTDDAEKKRIQDQLLVLTDAMEILKERRDSPEQ